jgi:hypothetical protein
VLSNFLLYTKKQCDIGIFIFLKIRKKMAIDGHRLYLPVNGLYPSKAESWAVVFRLVFYLVIEEIIAITIYCRKCCPCWIRLYLWSHCV